MPDFSPVQSLLLPEAQNQRIEVLIKRDDLVHPTIMGNKWRKLKYNLEVAKKLGKTTLLTFGGAFSNHIQATAIAAKEFGFESIGYIRGEELTSESNITLREASRNGMELKFVTRTEFREIKKDLKTMEIRHPNAYVLPEGGTNSLAIKGAMEIVEEIKEEKYDFLVCPIGTGGTMAGILKALPEEKKVVGISSLKGDFIHQEFEKLLTDHAITKDNYSILNKYHFGGYGRTSSELIKFINTFRAEFGVMLDPVYTGKMMFAVRDLIKNGFFPEQSKVIIIHTGGLQGIEGFNEMKGKMIL
ncbi:1-aminocyclopropane-1-carboxylate deaminase/D-cysteine desulfhydrase [Marinoscillum sp. MHG1-6]|uniref:1-aminocyclopropane-1-carboxylate deaminase/D-cysteine desulfhydrase n=1 Tax=Marinoscillum sp. MHG1-6 TaxID=2959627 RepID=UPI0021578C4D|nr:pyridoxal-phosphate dependent enzyme [Marinoscillum sp. MHG1-6]